MFVSDHSPNINTTKNQINTTSVLSNTVVFAVRSRYVQNALLNVRGIMTARRLQMFAQREWASELSSFSIEIGGPAPVKVTRLPATFTVTRARGFVRRDKSRLFSLRNCRSL